MSDANRTKTSRLCLTLKRLAGEKSYPAQFLPLFSCQETKNPPLRWVFWNKAGYRQWTGGPRTKLYPANGSRLQRPKPKVWRRSYCRCGGKGRSYGQASRICRKWTCREGFADIWLLALPFWWEDRKRYKEYT